ncbi:TetR/AcrR family transcriptional regulator [Mesorhizobium sp. YM1C-6-2]|uniref:TetR/AcrR family transcriptional regulator n=1 Tax=Mesorhizobium sp. YM1C-6-2 TaxID=1827501 RepID=UPI000EF1D0FF|nr:TetR/AcrR family transcriptional regulator [Mesorhizobium sp. YM1C-6-2]RLP24395.1 TetR/AcrR family transcriptional regulator [Mesorhizobium sp. YM1C-6-2]
MGRTRTFDRDAVLFAAANAFRQRGFRDVSIAELEKATGLVSGSIYNAFGDKAGLFRAALHHYVHGFVKQRLDAFAGESATLEDLEGLILSTLEPPLSDGFGCLVTNSIVEFGREEGLASADIADTLVMTETAIGDVLARELGPATPEAATLHLMTLYHGVLTLSRSRVPTAAMAAMVRAEFARLKALRDGAREKNRN